MIEDKEKIPKLSSLERILKKDKETDIRILINRS